MGWPQVYDPVHAAWLSTLLAALPIIVLLGGLAVFRLRAHVAALLGLGTALAVSVAVFGMPAGLALRTAAAGRGLRPLPHRLDHPQRHLPLRPDRRDGPLQGHAGQPDRHHPRPPPPAPAHRLFVRGVLRGRGRVRDAGRRHGRHPHRAGLRRRSRLRDCPSSPTPRPSPSAPWGRRSSPWPGSPGSTSATSAPWSGASCRSSPSSSPSGSSGPICGFTQDERGLARPARRRVVSSPCPSS